MKKCAFLTLDDPADYVIDDEHAIEPLNQLGWQVSTLSWRQTQTPWSEFELVIIRSTWDYWNDVPAFLAALEKIDNQTRLANRLNLVRWNLSKTYMQDLHNSGIGIVPTLWENSLEQGFITSFQDRLGVNEIVVKPVVGANGEDAYRVTADDSQQHLDDIVSCFQGRACMVQPFMPGILSEGEYSLFYFAGNYSHAILKIPAKSEFRSQEERGAEIRSIVPGEELLRRAGQAMATVSPSPLYARIDLIRGEKDDFLVMELELIEPSLYLRMDADAAGRFAASIDKWV